MLKLIVYLVLGFYSTYMEVVLLVSKIIFEEIIMNLKRSPFSILNKERREIDYIKGVYKRKIQAEIESYKDPEDEDKRDTIQAQDVLMLDRISI